MTEQELKDLIAKAQARYDAMTSEEQDAMWKAQRESYVRSIVDWPKPVYRMENGTKVYASYSDYVND